MDQEQVEEQVLLEQLIQVMVVEQDLMDKVEQLEVQEL
jgi:hypothetical protein